MAQPQQEEGWPLGLQPLNVRVGLVPNHDHSASLSFNTLLTASPISTVSSSDLDTQSTGSFFHDKSITLGNLIGISNILELSRRSTRGRILEPARNKKNNYKTRTWFLSLCSKLGADVVTMDNNAPSLGHFLEAERRAAGSYPRNPSPYGPDDFSHAFDLNSLFVEGHVAPPPQPSGEVNLGRDLLAHENDDGPPLLLSCLCGNL